METQRHWIRSSDCSPISSYILLGRILFSSISPFNIIKIYYHIFLHTFFIMLILWSHCYKTFFRCFHSLLLGCSHCHYAYRLHIHSFIPICFIFSFLRSLYSRTEGKKERKREKYVKGPLFFRIVINPKWLLEYYMFLFLPQKFAMPKKILFSSAVACSLRLSVHLARKRRKTVSVCFGNEHASNEPQQVRYWKDYNGHSNIWSYYLLNIFELTICFTSSTFHERSFVWEKLINSFAAICFL